LEKGGRFVQFNYAIVTPVYWAKKPSNIYYIPSDKKAISKGWPYLLVCIFLGLIIGVLFYRETDVTESIKKARDVFSKRFKKNYTFLDTIYRINQDIERYNEIDYNLIEETITPSLDSKTIEY
jgi:hypothetical protein